MLKMQFQPFPVLQTERLELRQMMPEDAPDVFVLRSDPDILRYLDKDACASVEEAAKWIGEVTALHTENKGINWGICLSGGGPLIGYIGLWRVVPEHYRAEVGYVLLPEHHRKQFMSEAMQKVLVFGFGPMGLHSIEAHVNPDNAASIRLLEKHGFVREAYFRENYFWAGRFLDTAVYSCIAGS